MVFPSKIKGDAIENIKRRLSQALALRETETVLGLYKAIGVGDVAGGAPLNWASKRMDWNAVMALHNAVKGENWKPTVLVLIL